MANNETRQRFTHRKKAQSYNSSAPYALTYLLTNNQFRPNLARSLAQAVPVLVTVNVMLVSFTAKFF